MRMKRAKRIIFFFIMSAMIAAMAVPAIAGDSTPSSAINVPVVGAVVGGAESVTSPIENLVTCGHYGRNLPNCLLLAPWNVVKGIYNGVERIFGSTANVAGAGYHRDMWENAIKP
ncbi:MAG: hypothetical protein HQL08_06675 [Nitrospirae bacterium]|nr:hypothetical protein [Nitrospirota bacterium]